MSKIKIMLVEDHQIVIDGLEALLAEEEDLTIVKAVLNGQEALQVAKDLKPDLVVLDINLPDKSGFTVCKELKNELGLLLQSFYIESFKKIVDQKRIQFRKILQMKP